MHNYINVDEHYAFSKFSQNFKSILLEKIDKQFDSIVIVCIGTDRSTGDSLGPLIGYKLSSLRHNNVYIYGSLDNPVHAKNLLEKSNEISAKHPNALIIAIDACLGSPENVGCVNIEIGPLRPGAGVNKNLPQIGHVSITGIVNFGGFMDFMILQNTRLNVVMKMADLISLGIKHSLSQIGRENSFFSSDLTSFAGEST